MAVKTLDDVSVRGLISRAKRDKHRVEMRDTKITGLTLRCHPTGSATWSLTYRLKGLNKLARHGLGVYPTISLKEARDGAKDFLAKVQFGDDKKEEADKAKFEDGKPHTQGTFIATARFVDRRVRGQPPRSG